MWMRPSGPRTTLGEQRECLLEIAVKADEGFEDVGGERRAGGGAGGDFDTVCLGSDSDLLGAFFGTELKIKLVGLLGIEGDAFGESFKAREADGDFTFAWENRQKEYWPRSFEIVEISSLLVRFLSVIFALGQTVWT
jgi:hypothetical protein